MKAKLNMTSAPNGACPRDTDSEAHRVWITGIRRMSVAQRVACARSLTRDMVSLSRRAIARAHPAWDTRQVDLHFVRLHYGSELADAVRTHLAGTR